jgi:hypothetical protein
MSSKQFKMRRFNYELILAFMLSVCMMSMSSCNKTEDGGENGEEPEEAFYQVFGSSNPYDQIIALIFSKDNDTIMVFGDKDENGVPLGIKEMILRPNDAEGRTTIKFDDLQRPVDFTAPNDVRMLLEWLDESSAALTMIEPSTGEQLNTVVYFDERNQTRAIKHSNNTRNGNAVMEINTMPNNNYCDQQLCKNNGITGYLLGYTCHDMPDSNGSYFVRAFKRNIMGDYDFGIPIATFNCTHISGNEYQYTIPSGIFETPEIDNLHNICDKIDEILNSFCTAYNATGIAGPAMMSFVCTSISAALVLSELLAPVAPTFLTACEGMTASITAYCSILGNSAMPGSNSISQELGLCQLIQDIVTDNDKIRLVPYINTLSGAMPGVPVLYNGVGDPGLLYAGTNGVPSITSFTLDPSAPVVEQGYIATAHIICVPMGTNITMSIEGTDGYTDSQTQYVSESTPYLDATLSVPGAHESGIYDVCTTTVVLPDGTTLTKTASLVFQ